MKKILILGMLSILIFNCTTKRYLKLEPVNTTENIGKGSVAILGLQIKDPADKWSTTSGNYRTEYTVPFKRPELLASNIMFLYNTNVFKNLKFKYLKLRTIDKYKTQMKKLHFKTDYYTFNTYIPVFDKKDDPLSIDPIVMNFLNKDINADYYVVLYGEIKNVESKGWFRLKLSITPLINVTVFNKNGIKIFSKNYTKKYENVKDIRKLTVYPYYKHLENLINESKEEIISDLEFLNHKN